MLDLAQHGHDLVIAIHEDGAYVESCRRLHADAVTAL